MKVSELFEGKKTFSDFDAWKAAVLKKYPAEASKMKFKGRVENSKDTISAEIPGQDRSYGVWDQDAETGEVLSEGKAENLAKLKKDYKDAQGWIQMSKSDRERRGHEATVQRIASHAKKQYGVDLQLKESLVDSAKTMASKIGKWLIKPTVTDAEVKAYVDALKTIKDMQMFARIAKELTTDQLQQSVQLPANKAAKEAFSAELKSRGLKESLLEAKFKLGSKVKIVKGPEDVCGIEGHIGEIRKDIRGVKTFTIDYDRKGAKSGDRQTSIQLKSTDLRLVEAMSSSQAAHEIKWLKNKIEDLKKNLDKKPSVSRQIKDLERQIKERELGQTFTESVANMHKLADAFKAKLNKKLKDLSLGFRHTRNGFENSKYSINLEIDTDDNDGFVTYSIKKIGGDKAISKSEPLDQDDSIITSIIRAVRS